MTFEEAEKINEKMGTDIIEIVMNYKAGRASAGHTMILISEYGKACYQMGREAARDKILTQLDEAIDKQAAHSNHKYNLGDPTEHIDGEVSGLRWATVIVRRVVKEDNNDPTNT